MVKDWKSSHSIPHESSGLLRGTIRADEREHATAMLLLVGEAAPAQAHQLDKGPERDRALGVSMSRVLLAASGIALSCVIANQLYSTSADSTICAPSRSTSLRPRAEPLWLRSVVEGLGFDPINAPPRWWLLPTASKPKQWFIDLRKTLEGATALCLSAISLVGASRIWKQSARELAKVLIIDAVIAALCFGAFVVHMRMVDSWDGFLMSMVGLGVASAFCGSIAAIVAAVPLVCGFSAVVLAVRHALSSLPRRRGDSKTSAGQQQNASAVELLCAAAVG